MTFTSPGNVYVVGTADTKGEELRYVSDLIKATGCGVTLVDVGTVDLDTVDTDTVDTRTGADIGPAEVAAFHPEGAEAVRSDDCLLYTSPSPRDS